jgi:hypothetical protein
MMANRLIPLMTPVKILLEHKVNYKKSPINNVYQRGLNNSGTKWVLQYKITRAIEKKAKNRHQS